MTKDKIADSSLLAMITTMPPAGSVEPKLRAKVGDDNGKGGTTTSKDKSVLGIDKDNIITWCYPNFDHVTSQQLKNIAKSTNQTPSELFTRVVHQWVMDNHDDIVNIGGEIALKQTTTEELTKRIAAAKAKLARDMAMYESMMTKSND